MPTCWPGSEECGRKQLPLGKHPGKLCLRKSKEGKGSFGDVSEDTRNVANHSLWVPGRSVEGWEVRKEEEMGFN